MSTTEIKYSFRVLTLQRKIKVTTIAQPKKWHLLLYSCIYNQNKEDEIVFDQLARKYTTHAATRRLPLIVWKNLFNHAAALSSLVLYKKYSDSFISWRNFILQLIEKLREA